LDELRTRRDDILRAAAANGARSIQVFGSVARREDRPDSDIDFLVQLEPGRTLVDLSGLQLELEELLSRRVQVVQIPSIVPKGRQRAAARIRRDAVAL
jgi:predicted nucleotidyltransferase